LRRVLRQLKTTMWTGLQGCRNLTGTFRALDYSHRTNTFSKPLIKGSPSHRFINQHSNRIGRIPDLIFHRFTPRCTGQRIRYTDWGCPFSGYCLKLDHFSSKTSLLGCFEVSSGKRSFRPARFEYLVSTNWSETTTSYVSGLIARSPRSKRV